MNQEKKDGAFPLFIAAQNGDVHVCSLLLENNAHVNQEKKMVHLHFILQHRMIMFKYAAYYLRTMHMLIKKRKMDHLRCLLLHVMVMFTYATYYLRTTQMLIKERKMMHLRCLFQHRMVM